MEQTFFPVTRREAERSGAKYSSEKNKNAGFPSRLRELRKKKGVSQDIVSKELGVSKSTVGLWETGDTLPDAKAVRDLASYYEVSTDYLLGRTDISSLEVDDYEYFHMKEYNIDKKLSEIVESILYCDADENVKTMKELIFDIY